MTLPQQKDKLKSKNLLPRVTHEALQVFACDAFAMALLSIPCREHLATGILLKDVRGS